MIREPWFQDNTLVFDVLLNDEESFVMCVYPPGSGKSTLAILLKYYLSSNGMPEEVRNFLDNCRFQQKENERVQSDSLYTKFRASASYVLVADFSEVKGRTYSELEDNYSKYMLKSWRASGLPDQLIEEEKESLKAGHVWTSLLRLRDSVCADSGNVYVILDSVDNMYNLIANLPVNESKQIANFPSEEIKSLYSRFTEGIAGIIHRGTRKIKTFCFGVSPYLITEFQKYAISCYFLDLSLIHI